MLSRIYDIPIAVCWNRVRFLEEQGFVFVVLTFFSGSGEVLTFYHLAPGGREALVEARAAAPLGPA